MARPFGYQIQRFGEARSSLMAPYIAGEDSAFANAFNACSIGLHDLNMDQVKSSEAIQNLERVRRLVDTSNVEDPTGEGTSLQLARSMSWEQKHEFSKAVDELADYFNREFWAD